MTVLKLVELSHKAYYLLTLSHFSKDRSDMIKPTKNAAYCNSKELSHGSHVDISKMFDYISILQAVSQSKTVYARFGI